MQEPGTITKYPSKRTAKVEHKKILLAVVLLMVLGSACNKSTVFTGPKIYVLTDFKLGTVSTYTYNSDGTVTSVVADIGSKSTYQYNNSISPKEVLVDNYSFNNSGTPNSGTLYFLNSNGIADSAVGQYTSANVADAYNYDGNNQPTEQRHYVLGALNATYDFTNVNKNVTEMITTTPGSNTKSYDYYTYLASNSNTTGVQDKGEYYLGISPNNIISTDIKINGGGDTTDIISYRYHYDTNSRIDTAASYHRNGIQIDSMAFTYY